ncbi:MAG TPA: hypothetical protein VFC21_06470 [Bryobacteraceae bacterium]|nr:hypothetical protein [Bryobacteraceae bacterium]
MTGRTALICAAALALAGAQPQTAKWTELQRHDLSGIGRTGVEMSIEISQGSPRPGTATRATISAT